jgi:DNA polymerase I
MERAGFGVDRSSLCRVLGDAQKRLLAAEIDLARIAGRRIKPNSSKLKGGLANYGIKVENTKEETLALESHPITRQILVWRHVEKERQFATLLLEAITPEGRIYSNYNASGAESGRFSCDSPNLQQVPRGPIRSAFTAPEGRALVICDYDQIELRVCAYLANDTRMLEAFRLGADLHKATAETILSKSNISPEDRQLAKAVNFGAIYGQSPAGLVVYAQSTFGVAMTLEEAAKHRDRFFKYYSGLARWHQGAWNKVKYTTEGRTAFGRRRLVPYGATDWTKWQVLVNFPVQGGAADGLKLSLLRLGRELPLGVELVAAIHDEVILEAPLDKAEEVRAWAAAVMVEEMSKLFNGLPITVSSKVAKTWSQK